MLGLTLIDLPNASCLIRVEFDGFENINKQRNHSQRRKHGQNIIKCVRHIFLDKSVVGRNVPIQVNKENVRMEDVDEDHEESPLVQLRVEHCESSVILFTKLLF